MSGFHDHFSGHAADYRKYRPDYPAELFAWLAMQAPDREMAWDCGTGNGQAAVGLSPHFRKVVATDASAKQVAEAEPRPNIEYYAAPAEASGLADGSIDLVTVAQALHWFDFPRFFDEVRRVCRPGGLFAAITYNLPRVDERCDTLLERFQYQIVGPYWPPERRHVDANYETIHVPFPRIETPRFELTRHWNLGEVMGYLSTWSATKKFVEVKGFDPVDSLSADFAKAWGDPSEVKRVRWTLRLLAGRVHA